MLLIFTAVPMGLFGIKTSAENETSGNCGAYAQWSLDIKTGILTISGNGAINDYSYSIYYDDCAPWYSQRDSIKTIKIEKGITTIGNEAFYDCYCVSSVELPDSLEIISRSSFSGCSSLTSLVIPYGVNEIEFSAFENCTKLNSISIPDSVIKIGPNAFKNTAYYNNPNNWKKDILFIGGSLIDANRNISGDCVIPNGVRIIAEGAFSSCWGITTVDIPNSVESIGPSAFTDCNSLKTVTINGSIKYINYYTFSECKNLTAVTLPDSVLSIGDFAFYNCVKLNSISMPEGLSSIGNYAFSECKNLTAVTLPDSVIKIGPNAFKNTSYYNNPNNWKKDILFIGSSLIVANRNISGDCVIPNGVRIIADDAFDSCDQITSINIPNSVTNIGNEAFRNCNGLKKVYVTDITKWCNIDFSSFRSNPLYNSYAEYYVNNVKQDKIIIPNSVTKIKKYAFAGDSYLTEIFLFNTLKEIDESAFERADIKNVWYNGSETNGLKIRVGDLASATWHYNSCIMTEEHIYGNICDSICNLCGYKRITSHKYSNACDEYCNICNHKRTAPHVYKNDCSRQCSLCRQYRTIKHTYEKNPIWSYDSNKHWQRCYVCNILTDKENHIYDNDSDPTCNTCGYVRILDKGLETVTVPRGYTGIYDYSDLQKINENPSGKYILMQDIDLFAEDEIVISREFTGIFNGNGYTISNLKIKNNSNSNAVSGLFYHNKGVICNLRINNPELYCITGNASAYAETGVIAAQNSGTIRNCFILNPNIQTFGGIHSVSGGIAGVNNSNGKIQYCTVSKQTDCAIVSYGLSDSCKSYSGGICGRNSGTISSCNNYVKTYANSENITYGGGIAAYNSGMVENSYSTGFVLWYKKAKTIYYASAVGYNDYSGKIENVYCNNDSLCIDNDKKEIPRIILVYKNFGSIKNCYLENINIAGVDITVGSYGEKMTSAQMKNKDTYEGFDFDNVWIMGTYPELRSYNYSECVNGSNHSGGKATCQGQAVCEICGVYYGKKADHTYTEWQTAYEANCTKEGLKVHHCLYCGLEEKTQIAVNNKHVYTEGDDDCTLCGHKYTSVIGDTNGDEVINGKDVVYLCNYLANYDYETGKSTVDIFEGADANGDGEINGKDVIILCNYLANFDYETGKSTVELGKGSKRK